MPPSIEQPFLLLPSNTGSDYTEAVTERLISLTEPHAQQPLKFAPCSVHALDP